MREHAARRREPCRHQEGRPIYGMEAHNFLSNQMQIRRPKLPARRLFVRKSASGDIVIQGVEPDIHDVPGSARYWDAPAETRTADRKIVQSATHETQNLVAPRAW